MTDAYASLEDLKNRLSWTLSEAEERMATSALEDASDDVRFYGREWDYDSAPRQVRKLVLKACKRYMDNPEDYVQSRAGDESVSWTDRGERGGSPSFTEPEIAVLRELAGKTAYVLSVPTQAWGSADRLTDGFVPVESGGKYVPFFAAEDGGW